MKKIFTNLTNLGATRTPVQAVGFYIFYFFVILFMAGVAAGVAGVVSGLSDPERIADIGYSVGLFLTPVLTLVLGVLLLSAKKFTKNKKYIALVVGAAFISWLLGGLFGIIPLAYLTTRKEES